MIRILLNPKTALGTLAAAAFVVVFFGAANGDTETMQIGTGIVTKVSGCIVFSAILRYAR
jgi:hypothetical protein